MDADPVPLPSDPNTPWPPTTWQPIAQSIAEAGVWYSGDTGELAAFYGGANTSKKQRTVWGRDRSNNPLQNFWGRRDYDACTDRQRLHLPAAADVAATSADLLFGEAPNLVIPEAHDETPDTDALATEEYLADRIDTAGIESTLLESAELCAGLGDIYLRLVWDPQVSDRTIVNAVQADHAVPEFRWGQMVAVTFWREVQTDNTTVWRHLERYERGVIMHGLYIGDNRVLGRQVPLDSHPATRGLDTDDEGAIHLPDLLSDQLLVRHIPNARPNRRHRGQPIGRADTAGSESLMDALDEVWTALMREIRLVRPRIIVPGEYLERRGRGKGATFNADQDIFMGLDMDPSSQEKAGITPAEFQLHTDQYLASAAALFERIVIGSGYAPASFGLGGEQTEITATEVVARENRTIRTSSRKRRYWRRPTEDILELLLVADKQLFGAEVVPMRPRLDFADGLPDDPRQTAETIELLRRAQAISVETGVRMAQPHLEGEELKAEVDRVMGETGMAVPDPAVIGREGEGL